MINLCIIDDDLRLASEIRNELISYPDFNWITVQGSGLAYFNSLHNLSPTKLPGCILMDISMTLPDEGIQTTRLFHQKFPDIKIIMFTISDENDNVFEAFKAGAVGYLLKNEKIEFIYKTIIEVTQGGALMSPTIAMKTIKFLTANHLPEPNPSLAIPQLTDRELQILRMISKGFKYQYIADELFISIQTVKKHMGNIFEKLHVHNKIEALNISKNLL